MRRYAVPTRGHPGSLVESNSRMGRIGRAVPRLTVWGTVGLLLALFLVGGVPIASADTATLVASQDTYTDSTMPNSNFEGGASIDIGHDTTPSVIRRRALIQFDLSPLFAEELAPAVEIVSATVTFRCGQLEGTPWSYGWHLITSAWSASTVTHNTLPSFQANASVIENAQTDVGGCPSGALFIDDITPLAASWLAGPNNGMIGISTNESLDAHLLLRSTEHPEPPSLVVVYATVLPTGGQSSWFILAVGISVVVLLAATLNLIINGIENARDIVVLIVSIVIVIGVVGILVAGGF